MGKDRNDGVDFLALVLPLDKRKENVCVKRYICDLCMKKASNIHVSREAQFLFLFISIVNASEFRCLRCLLPVCTSWC